MASSKWKTIDEINSISKEKKIIFWGASHWIDKIIGLINSKDKFIVDNNVYNQGHSYAGLNIFSPEELKKFTKDEIYVVITTGNYSSVIDELSKMSFIMGENFCCAPPLNVREDIDNINNLDFKVLLTSHQHQSDKTSGGGLYLFETKSRKLEKKYSGKCRGLHLEKNFFLVVDMLKGILKFDYDYNILDTIQFEKNSEPHGIFYDNKTDLIYLGTPGRDSISIYSLKKKIKVDEFFISNKWNLNKKDNHHLNDVFFKNNYLYISLFSIDGKWSEEIYDGGILKIDLKEKKIKEIIHTDLKMPHSICFVEDKICFCDSMRGDFWYDSNKISSFSGYLRGIDYEREYFILGVSEHRYPEKMKKLSNNINLNTGIYILDKNTKINKFFDFSDKFSALHALKLINKKYYEKKFVWTT